ncbi:MAG TPA: chromosomal replication initiator protein DnaA [Patescibacteria group bacterium]|nr:chromosomal replication initiator protein DnaA [Patescibacteria group bacterium]
MTTHELWQAALGELELSLSKANYTTWFRNTFISAFEEGRIVVSVPNTFTKAWLEKKYHAAILKALQNVAKEGGVREVHYKVELKPSVPQDIGTPIGSPSAATPAVAAQAEEEATEGTKDFSLNPRYTFENFIVGKTNELAHAAALAVTEKPGRYNPLFVYGGVGLGKTHLLQAIGHKMIEMNPRTKVLYVTCERFTNEFIHAVRNGRGKEFKDTYRSLDLLLIDDIQFITGKEGTQEEFFHTFNTLHQSNKQIVLSSDRPPKAIQGIEQRLVSRFEWGMMVDISAPDLETRVAILESKCKEKHYELSREILSYVASSVQSNVRELEGTLNKIIAYHQFKNIKPSMESIRELVSSINSAAGSKKNLTPKDLLDTVAGYYDIALPDLLGKCREKRLSFPRQIIMYLMREELNSSYPAIGKMIGGRDHTTAIHAYTKIQNDLQEDEKLRHDLNLIRQRLYSAA